MQRRFLWRRKLILLFAILFLVSGIVFATRGGGGPKDRESLRAEFSLALTECFKTADMEKCLAPFVSRYLDTFSAKEVLAELNAIQGVDPAVRNSCHPVVHVIGREVYKREGNIPDSFARCDQTCHSGCYHGAMERFLRGEAVYADKEGDHVTGKEVMEKVKTACPSSEPLNLRFQCLHGLGHAVLFFWDYNLVESLKVCELVGDAWGIESCHGGAFMENITASEKDKRYLSSTDYHFPCSALDSKYKNTCYAMQTSRMLEMGLNKEGIAEECKKAGEWRAMCMQSLGRDISNDARTISPSVASSVCTTLLGADREACIRGVTYALSDNTWDGTYAFPFCESFSQSSDQQYCYQVTRSYLRDTLVQPESVVERGCAMFVPSSRFCRF